MGGTGILPVLRPGTGETPVPPRGDPARPGGTGRLGRLPDQSVKLTTVGVEVMPCQANLISDPGFEQSPANGIPSGWQWTRGKTDATCAIDRTVAHSGRQSLRMTNGTPFGPNVYGMLWRTQPVKLIWGKPYTMSAWVKSDEPGGVELIGGGDWQYRAGPTWAAVGGGAFGPASPPARETATLCFG